MIGQGKLGMIDCQCAKRVKLGRDEPSVHIMRWQIKYFHFSLWTGWCG